MGNTAGYGAGIFTENDAVTTLRQCTIANNTAITQAGAIYNRGTTILIHCTVSGNTSQADSGGIYSQGGWFLSLDNSIVSGNTAVTTAPNLYNFGTLTNSGVNIIQTGVNGSGVATGSG